MYGRDNENHAPHTKEVENEIMKTNQNNYIYL